jgi:hypothetical protein
MTLLSYLKHEFNFLFIRLLIPIASAYLQYSGALEGLPLKRPSDWHSAVYRQHYDEPCPFEVRGRRAQAVIVKNVNDKL